MAIGTWLVDKSALVRLATSPDSKLWIERIGRGLVHITTVTLLEVGHSARSAPDLAFRPQEGGAGTGPAPRSDA